MIRFAYATLSGLLGAVFVHLAIVFLLPQMSVNTAWRIVTAATAENVPYAVSRGFGSAPISAFAADIDPFFETAICRYDLRDGALHVRSDDELPIWTLSVKDGLGTSFFSANDRIAASGRLDLVVLDQRQLQLLRQNTVPDLADAIIVPASQTTGFVVVRGFVPDPSWQAAADQFVDGLVCRTVGF